MTRIEAILREVQSLSEAERVELFRALLDQLPTSAKVDDTAVAERGLDAFTESTRDESWADFYPDWIRDEAKKP